MLRRNDRRNRVGNTDLYNDDREVGKVGIYPTKILGVNANLAIKEARGYIYPEDLPITKEHVAEAIMRIGRRFMDSNNPQIGDVVQSLDLKLCSVVDEHVAKEAHKLHGPPQRHCGGLARIWTKWIADASFTRSPHRLARAPVQVSQVQWLWRP